MPRAKNLVLFGCIHAFLMIGLFTYGFDLSAVDGMEPTPGKQIAMTAVGVLMLPARLLRTGWAGENENAFQWLLLIANSTLWGCVIAAVVQRSQSRRSS
jgi:hypothetical protein